MPYPNHIEEMLAELEKSLPPLIVRSKINDYLGGLIAPGYLSTLDSKGTGPKEAMRFGRHVCYPKKTFLDWLGSRLTSPKEMRGVRVPKHQTEADMLLNSLHAFSKKNSHERG